MISWIWVIFWFCAWSCEFCDKKLKVIIKTTSAAAGAAYHTHKKLNASSLCIRYVQFRGTFGLWWRCRTPRIPAWTPIARGKNPGTLYNSTSKIVKINDQCHHKVLDDNILCTIRSKTILSSHVQRWPLLSRITIMHILRTRPLHQITRSGQKNAEIWTYRR